MPSNKRKRSGPGLSFADRDARSSGPSTSNRSNNGGGGKRSNYNQPYRLPSKLISGPGIFVTCVQGKERKAALQFIDHLNEVADRIYKDVKLLPPLKREEEEKKKDEERERGSEEDLMDAMRNGPAPVAEAADREETEEPTQQEEETKKVEEEEEEEKKAPLDDLELSGSSGYSQEREREEGV